MKTFQKTITFHDANNMLITLEAEITERNGYPEFAISGKMGGSCGQILDSFKPANKPQEKLVELWKNYHLKDVSNIHNFEELFNGIVNEIEKEEQKIIPLGTLQEMMADYGLTEAMEKPCKAYLDHTGAKDLSDFEESYRGEFSSDEEFAKEEAEQCDAIDRDSEWPNNCIDWEKAARELMMDYSEQNGFYFRNL